MAEIVSVGFNFPGNELEYIPLESKRSFLDADAILICPDIGPFITTSEMMDGLPHLSSKESFALQDALLHWRQEVPAALQAGKNIIVYLTALQRVVVETGQRRETVGRSVRRTVSEVTNYDTLGS